MVYFSTQNDADKNSLLKVVKNIGYIFRMFEGRIKISKYE
jgi:hypothetical protein